MISKKYRRAIELIVSIKGDYESVYTAIKNMYQDEINMLLEDNPDGCLSIKT